VHAGLERRTYLTTDEVNEERDGSPEDSLLERNLSGGR
jgi:hypothetical protein